MARNRERARQYREKNRDHINALKKNHHEKYREEENLKRRDRNLRQLYGVAPEEYESMLSAQSGGCAVCGETNKNRRRLYVDHDHETGKVRGLLCHRCNRVLGSVNDSPELLRRLIDYLKRHGK